MSDLLNTVERLLEIRARPGIPQHILQELDEAINRNLMMIGAAQPAVQRINPLNHSLSTVTHTATQSTVFSFGTPVGAIVEPEVVEVPESDFPLCPICFNHDTEKNLFQLCCMARFHPLCLLRWFNTPDDEGHEKVPTCPNCRFEYPEHIFEHLESLI